MDNLADPFTRAEWPVSLGQKLERGDMLSLGSGAAELIGRGGGAVDQPIAPAVPPMAWEIGQFPIRVSAGRAVQSRPSRRCSLAMPVG